MPAQINDLEAKHSSQDIKEDSIDTSQAEHYKHLLSNASKQDSHLTKAMITKLSNVQQEFLPFKAIEDRRETVDRKDKRKQLMHELQEIKEIMVVLRTLILRQKLVLIPAGIVMLFTAGYLLKSAYEYNNLKKTYDDLPIKQQCMLLEDFASTLSYSATYFFRHAHPYTYHPYFPDPICRLFNGYRTYLKIKNHYYDSLYDSFSNEFFVTCRLSAPFIIIELILLTILSALFFFPEYDHSREERYNKEIIIPAKRYNIDHNGSFYSILQNAEGAFQAKNSKLALLNYAAEQRAAFLDGRKQKDSKISPINKLFNVQNERGIHDKIFAMAGISNTAVEIKLAEPARHQFELGGHNKNKQPVLAAGGRVHFNPLFSFFDRLKNEKWRQPKSYKEKNNNSDIGDMKVVGHNKIDILKNIYEFAELVPTRPKNSR